MSGDRRTMTIVLNGEERPVPEGLTPAALLETLGLARARVAVEVNGRVVRRDALGRDALADRDRVEIVQLVGGG